MVRQRELLMSLVKRDLKVRYKDSVLGFFWSLCRPLVLMLILSVVFSVFVRIPVGVPYPIFLLTGLLPWMFFAASLTEASFSLLANAPLIKKVSLDAALFPVSGIVGNLIHLALAFVVYLLFLFYYGFGFRLDWWIVLPAVAIQTILCLALCLLASALNVWYRDVGSIVELGLTCWFYASPVLYPLPMALTQIDASFPEQAWLLRTLYLLNPITPVMALYRRAFLFEGDRAELTDSELALWTGIAAVVTALLAWLCWRVFERRRPYFADQL